MKAASVTEPQRTKVRKVTDALENALDSVIKVLSYVAIICMGIMMLVVVINVLGRFLFDKPLMGTLEIVELLMVPIGFFAIFYTAKLRGHVIIDLLFRRLPRRVRVVSASIGFFLCFAIWGVITYQAIPIAISYAQDLHQDTQVLSIPFAPFRAIMVLGGLILCLRLLVFVFHPIEDK